MLFVFGCAMPTLLTTLLVVVSCTPWYADHRRAGLERDLSSRLGVTVTIEAVEYPAPKTIRLVGVRLLEPETGAEVAQVRLVTWTRGDAKNAIRLSQPEIHSEHLRYVWRVVHDRFLCQPELTATAVRMAADDLTIHSRAGAVTLRDVDTWLRPLDRRVEVMIQCVPASRRDDAPVHISVVRDRGGHVAATDWTLQTGDIPLPCAALADHLPAMKNLGTDATFTGTLRWQVDRDGWSIDLGGSRFDNVELSELMHNVPHRLTGRAAVRFERCQIEPGKVVDVSGTLLSQQGYVGWSLLRSADSQLGFDVDPADHDDGRDVAYDRIALRFDLFGPQLSLAGICHQQRGFEFLEPGVVLASSGRGIVSSRGEPQSWASLVRTFWQDGRELLPASGQSAWLMQWLPSPHRPPATPPIAPRITGTSEYRQGFEAGPTIGQP